MSTNSFEQLLPSERCHIVGLQKLHGHSDRLLHMLGTMFWWCVATFSSGLWNIPTPVNQVLIKMHIRIYTLCVQQWPHKKHPGKKSGHMLHLLCHQGSLLTDCLQQESDHVWLWPGYHLHHNPAKHSYSGVVKESTGEWNGALLSSVMRVGSDCMRVMDIHIYSIDLVNVICWSAFVHNKQAPPQASWYGMAISYNSRSHLVFLRGKVNSAHYIAEAFNPVLLPFLRQEGDVLNRQYNTRPHKAAATLCALQGVQQLPWPARSPDLSPIEHIWWSGNLLFLHSLPQPLPNCDNRCKMLGTICRRMTFSTFMTVCMREYMPAMLLEGCTLCIDVTVWAPFTVMCVFHLVWIYHHIVLQW